MPRLRHLKNFQVIEPDYEQHEEQETPELRNELWSKQQENEFEGGRSWLSNSVIISSLSSDKIKTAISYHYQMAHLLESELHLRANATKQTHIPTWGVVPPIKLQHRRTNSNSLGKHRAFKGVRRLKLPKEVERKLIKCLEVSMIEMNQEKRS